MPCYRVCFKHSHHLNTSRARIKQLGTFEFPSPFRPLPILLDADWLVGATNGGFVCARFTLLRAQHSLQSNHTIARKNHQLHLRGLNFRTDQQLTPENENTPTRSFRKELPSIRTYLSPHSARAPIAGRRAKSSSVWVSRSLSLCSNPQSFVAVVDEGLGCESDY